MVEKLEYNRIGHLIENRAGRKEVLMDLIRFNSYQLQAIAFDLIMESPGNRTQIRLKNRRLPKSILTTHCHTGIHKSG